MAVIAGTLGNVAWVGDDPHSHIVANIQPQRFTLNYAGDTFDEPLLNQSHPNTVKGLSQWAATLEALNATPNLGNEGLVTYASGNVENSFAWRIDVNVELHPVPLFNATAPTVYSWIVGRYTWGGEYSRYLDDATNAWISDLPITAEPASAQFKYDENTADGVLGGTIITQNQNVTVDPRNPNQVVVPFVGDGALSATGTASVLPTGQFSPGSAATLRLTQTTGQAASGLALLQSFSMNVNVTEPIRVTVGGQGTGALTVG